LRATYSQINPESQFAIGAKRAHLSPRRVFRPTLVPARSFETIDPVDLRLPAVCNVSVRTDNHRARLG
jgi:hypothetical protein